MKKSILAFAMVLLEEVACKNRSKDKDAVTKDVERLEKTAIKGAAENVLTAIVGAEENLIENATVKVNSNKKKNQKVIEQTVRDIEKLEEGAEKVLEVFTDGAERAHPEEEVLVEEVLVGEIESFIKAEEEAQTSPKQEESDADLEHGDAEMDGEGVKRIEGRITLCPLNFQEYTSETEEEKRLFSLIDERIKAEGFRKEQVLQRSIVNAVNKVKSPETGDEKTYKATSGSWGAEDLSNASNPVIHIKVVDLTN